ncbi:MAG: efflux RND transporter permease subunit [Desulfobacterales bacterium]|nr:efflux RND transporter permease subunit [Desulfobacterales bacterium]
MKTNEYDKNPKQGPIAWMAGHSVSANLLMLVLLLGGLFMGFRIRKEVFPDFDMDMVNISVSYPGASPQEVETGIVLAVEEAVQGLEGVEKVRSTAKEGRGTVVVEMIEGEDIQKLAQEIQNEVDRINSFPDEAEEPVVAVSARKRYVVALALYGDQSEKVLREYAEYMRDKLIQDPGITQVDLGGVRDYEISIEISQDTLRTYQLTLETVAQRIRNAAVELPAGAVKTPGGDVMVRIRERRDYGHEFGKIPIITTNDGTQVLLEDIAVIRDGFEESDNSTTYNGKPAVWIDVHRVGEQTPISVSDAVKRVVSEFNESAPRGLAVDLRNDRSDVYRQRLGLLVKNGFFGLGLVFILLALFLEMRLAFWVSLGIPISFLGSLLILPAADLSINMISMFAFIVSLGIVVDDAIVVGENICYHHQGGLPWFKASVAGAREITMPVTFSVMTNMIAFMPMFFVPGFMGKIFKQIPVVVISVFAISLIESLFILPAHIGHQRDRKYGGISGWIHARQRRFSDAFLRMVDRIYGPFLSTALNWRYLTISIGIAVLLFTYGFVKSGRMGFELFPKIESDYARVTATVPFGTAFEKTKQVQEILVQAALEVVEENGGDKLMDGTFAWIYGNSAQVRLYLTPPDVRPLSTAKVTELWRKKVGEIAGLESLKFESDSGGPGRGAAISLELSHQSMEVLEKASGELAEAMKYYPRVTDVDDGFAPGKQQIDFQIKPEARSLGLQANDVARQVRHAYYGAVVLHQLRGRSEVTVMVRLPKNERISEYNLEEMILRTPKGNEIPLRNAVTLKRGRAYTDISRRNGRRIVTVTVDVRPRSKAGEILAAVKAEVLPELQRKYQGLTYSFEGRQADRRDSIQSLMKGLLGALVVIFAMLAIPLNSYVQPLIIMFAVPFGIVGAVVGHVIMGYSLSVLSMFGIVALSGVVVNDSLVLIDFANRKHKAGMSKYDAVHRAGIHRFRPIILTTLTTFGGLTPMIFETSRQARFLIPMALSLGFGIVFATVITLVLVPSLYLVIEDILQIIGAGDKTITIQRSAEMKF